MTSMILLQSVTVLTWSFLIAVSFSFILCRHYSLSPSLWHSHPLPWIHGWYTQSVVNHKVTKYINVDYLLFCSLTSPFSISQLFPSERLLLESFLPLSQTMKQLELMASFLVGAIVSFSVMPLYINIHFCSWRGNSFIGLQKICWWFYSRIQIHK